MLIGAVSYVDTPGGPSWLDRASLPGPAIRLTAMVVGLGADRVGAHLLGGVLRGQIGKEAHFDAAAMLDVRAALRDGHRGLQVVSGDDQVAAELG